VFKYAKIKNQSPICEQVICSDHLVLKYDTLRKLLKQIVTIACKVSLKIIG